MFEGATSGQVISDEKKKHMQRTPAATSYLITPPEEIHDSFTSQDGGGKFPERVQWNNQLPPLRAHTPPISPKSGKLPSLATATGFSSHDPTLFPDNQARRTASPEPLFPHISSPAKLPVLPKPTLHEPLEVPPNSLAARYGLSTKNDIVQFWRANIAEARMMNRNSRRNLPHPGDTLTRRDRFDEEQVHKLTRPAGVSKSRAQPKVANKHKAAVAASPIESPVAALPSRTRTRTPRARHSIDSSFPSAQQPAKHKRAPPTKKVALDNVSWRELPDYTPPTSTLDAPDAKPLSVVWAKGQPFDSENDPDRSELHPQEIVIATQLRLHAEQYLVHKRKIFQGKLLALQEEKNFTKTKAQTATTIDVNKASQLWVAFDRVGWFDRKWFEQYL